jgi:hypothetical protein
VEHWDRAEKQPALLLEAAGQNAVNDIHNPPKWVLRAKLSIFASTAENDESPETKLHGIANEIQAALRRDILTEGRPVSADEYGTTLGGLLRSCRIVSVDTEQGSIAGQGHLSVDVEMVAVEAE